jgi:hypothetical protein
MDDASVRDEPTEQPVSSSGPEAGQVPIPPVEELFDVDIDPTDFMSAQSFPASDPPSQATPRTRRG